MTPPEVVGTDILFGLVLAIMGSAFHWKFGSISHTVLVHLLEGGIPGVVLGCLLARRVPARNLKSVIALIALCAGLQMIWTGSRTLMTQHAAKDSQHNERRGCSRLAELVENRRGSRKQEMSTLRSAGKPT